MFVLLENITLDESFLLVLGSLAAGLLGLFGKEMGANKLVLSVAGHIMVSLRNDGLEFTLTGMVRLAWLAFPSLTTEGFRFRLGWELLLPAKSLSTLELEVFGVMGEK